MDALNQIIQREAEKIISKSSSLFSAPCRVIEALGNQKYRVQLITSDTQYNLMNFSGSDLQVGESAQIFYRNNIISEQTAYIGASLTKEREEDDYRFIEKTQEQYDNMTSHDSKTIYLIVESPDEYKHYRIIEKTQTEYDSMTSHDADTVYLIVEEG